MRLWSLHPELLDTKGLVACWRETLLAQKVLAGQSSGYTNHPQLARLQSTAEPLATVGAYLQGILDESLRRGYHFDASKILRPELAAQRGQLAVTSEQLNFEYRHLLRKLEVRSPQDALMLAERHATEIPVHPLFHVIAGPIASWEKDSQAV
ncbi:pyrimidine dimer DNA glycosylase/endonuclease V [Arthrobacter sp. MYb213]|uniref:pyrimidine dimer DNA glycosylase/endonuclease V n=1 Tax=Arthrobacter sp. MYb213 TaxID=1848595 RepID=UPI000CFA9EEF|nr:pyrimidine dimer DNA glycosylase/endonuclease V [Arthrobacter sp. MYb213]PRB69201.1 DNA lyase [Arthrobacter sp. MYb213]